MSTSVILHWILLCVQGRCYEIVPKYFRQCGPFFWGLSITDLSTVDLLLWTLLLWTFYHGPFYILWTFFCGLSTTDLSSVDFLPRTFLLWTSYWGSFFCRRCLLLLWTHCAVYCIMYIQPLWIWTQHLLAESLCCIHLVWILLAHQESKDSVGTSTLF